MAIPLIEKFVKYNPERSLGYVMLAMLYAHAGRAQDAQSMLNKGTKGWPDTFKNVQFVMSLLSIGDLQSAERFAAGLIKAGLTREPSGFYKIAKENRLTRAELKKLFFGRTVTGFALGLVNNGGSSELWTGRRQFVMATTLTLVRVGSKRTCSAISGAIFMRA